MIRLLASLLLLLGLAAGHAARAAEVIEAYDSRIVMSRQGPLTVTETIRVRAEGRDIRRGIFRDFPLTFTGEDGRTRAVDFEVISVTRDGQPENWFTENISGGVRIYTGSSNVLLNPGEYTYRITYETGRQIRFFEDHDELYWNVTGNGWRFPMRQVSATVVLPEGASALETAAFTGRYGESGTDAHVSVEGAEVFFAATRPLAAGEGLTVAVKLAKGAVAAPSAGDEAWWFLKDNRNLILGFGGFLLVLAYYFRAWVAVGRDPPAGVMVPRWDPPDGISPALVNYIDNKGFSGAGWTALSATALHLAVNGYVVLEDLKNAIVIRRTDKPLPPDLPQGQAALLASVGRAGEALTIDKAHGETVQKAGRAFRAAIEKEHRGRYYRANAGYIAGGVALSVLALLALLIFGVLQEETMALAAVPAFFSVFLGGFVVKVGRGFRRAASLASRIASILALAFAGFVAFAVFGGIFAALVAELADLHELPVLAAAGGIVLVNALFFFLMGAPTPLGRRLMDGIEGLRTYLTLAEKDRLNMQGAPEMSPKHFETLLPYAVALGVEKPWTRTFETWLASAAAGAAAAAAYHPAWYHGDFSGGGFARRIGGFSSSMASTIASTIPTPQSSSGSAFSGGRGGGGFSGGGGGGGGGGGW